MTDNAANESHLFAVTKSLAQRASLSSILKAATLMLLIGLVAPTGSLAQTYTTLFSFDGTNGANPSTAPIQGFDGNLYGVTPSGGNSIGSSDCGLGCGTIFQLTPSGTLTTVYNFCSESNCTDGELPYGGLMLATNGSVYATTAGGGEDGNGTVFKITSKGQLATLYDFCSRANCTDGDQPIAAIVQAANGDFYGTALHGGDNNTCSGGCGTVFKLTQTGTFTTLYSFCSQANCVDGEFPQNNLVQAATGNLYGTTAAGGNPICMYGCGVIFEITPAGEVTTFYSFCSQSACTDGTLPVGALLAGTNGNLFGVTSYGGAHNSGEVFEITLSGKLTTLHSFCDINDCPDGAYPNAGLVEGNDGNLYGTTDGGGVYGHGAVFKITPTGQLTTLYSFCPQSGCTDGAYPFAGLSQATNGKFYGTTYGGGIENDDCDSGCGTIFSLSTGLPAFTEALPSLGRVGERVIILGDDLTGSTRVSFNGTSAAFTVISPTEIKTDVPAGATNGKIKVVTPHGTLVSNLVFRVTP